MRKDNINTVCHRWLKEAMKPDWIAIDATAGNGNDTLFLLQHCKHVYAFDIQVEAKEKTLLRCADYTNLTFSLLGHEHLQSIVKTPIDCALFNFGYLPHSESPCITQPSTSLAAVKQAYDLLKPDGIMVLCCYLGHEGGSQEHALLFQWIQQQTFAEVRTYSQHAKAPLLYWLQKKR